MTDRVEEQVFALAGIWQSVDLVYALANNSKLDKQQSKRFDCSLNSILVIGAQAIGQLYGSTNNLEFSLLSLYNFLRQGGQGQKEIATYMMQVIKLQKIVTKDIQMSGHLGEEIHRISTQRNYYENEQLVLVANTARLYSETLGSLPMSNRIKIKGVPSILQLTDTQNAIRTMLLAGIRAAMFWRQVGGSRWQLITHKKKLEDTIIRLLDRY